MRATLRVKFVVLSSLLLLFSLLGAGCTSASDFDRSLSKIVKAHRFSIAGWEFGAILQQVQQGISSRNAKVDGEADMVVRYFSSLERIKTLESEIEAARANKGGDLASLQVELYRLRGQAVASKNEVERIIERQVRETLTEQGIFNPIDKYLKLKFSFPPVNFKLEPPPSLLVISPRDRIESLRRILLKPGVSLEEMESIEVMADKLGVSSLVVGLGGLGVTYPTFVTNKASLGWTIDTVTEEWLHQYLAFRPLGFLYVLDLIGVSRNYDIATMNETVTSMVSKEIGAKVWAKYYPEYENQAHQNQPAGSGFDFNQAMREIRKVVDSYLARGEIEQAEKFMEQKRQYLESMGYHIRKLNQAYFAFHGTYADSPTSVSPIGQELKQLRNQVTSLKDFLDTVSLMTSRQSLRDRVE